MISCLIWPSINSWRHHNGLRTQNFNLHIMTSADFWKIDCISVNIDQFSFKFWYVLPETYSLQMQYPQISFDKTSWRIFAIKGGMSIFYILRVFSMGHDFFSKLDSTFSVFREQYLRRFIFVFAELRVCCSWDNKLSQDVPLFSIRSPDHHHDHHCLHVYITWRQTTLFVLVTI